MGASESTARGTNGTTSEDDDNPRRQPETGGGAGAAAVALAAVGVAAWGISRMLSSDDQQQRAGAAAVALAAVGVAAWGISRMLSSDDQQQNQNTINMNNSHRNTLESSHNNYLPNNSNTLSFPTRITWSPPPFGRFKMNTDGACRPSSAYDRSNYDKVDRGPSACGGILRDHRGKWIRGFYECLGVSDCLTAEFHGIHKGLLLLDRLGIKEAILETDSTGAVGWITQINANNRGRRSTIIDECWDIIVECKRLIVKNKISVIRCGRDANKCADKLASLALEKRELECMEIMTLPYEIKNIVDQEFNMV